MRAKLKTNVAGLGFAGDIVEVPGDLVGALLEAGAIEPVEVGRLETASIAPAAEVAMKPKAKARGGKRE